ncbi:MalM family protein [Psychromonas aquimarina]|uniref:MalM family protein n=1 Tax=Psychromonas aquimarina TaxID=444919 RepID=UPI000423E371|nr:MalM family protein [Psychromonas aquimarina]
MIIKQSSLILLAGLTLAGCSQSVLKSPIDNNAEAFIEPAKASLVLANKQPCCKDFSQLKYKEIANDDTLYIPLTSGSQVFAFPEGNSFVQAYKLTTKAKRLKLTVSGLIKNTAFAPQLTLLDANFNVTRTISTKHFLYKEASMLSGDMLSADLSIFRAQEDNSANETYLLFYTTEKAMADSTTIIHPSKAFAIAHGTVPPDIADPVIPHSAMGIIKLDVEAQGTKADVENTYIPEAIPAAMPMPSTKKVLTTEVEFNQAIVQAVAAKEIDKALTIVDDAEEAGFNNARETFIEALKNSD